MTRMRTEITPEEVDVRVAQLMRGMGAGAGAPGWSAGPVDVAALVRVAVMIAKAIGIPPVQVHNVVDQHWNELPEPTALRTAFRVPR